MKKLTTQHYLILILLFTAILRFYSFTSANVITDESLNAIRSLGLIDFDAARTQTTAWQWVEKVPAWMHLSMHDHPILTYLISHIFFALLGANLWGLRLPFILAGILSVYLIFLISRKLFNEKIGLISAFLLAINSYHIWISRIALQESLVILFILLTFYYFLKSLENKKHLLFVFVLLALSIISKYTAIILIPIFLIILLHQKKLKQFLSSRYFWLGLILFLIILSPSIIYNLKMQAEFGHLDFQLSAALGQDVPEWNVRLGREMVGGIKDRIINLPIKLKQGLSWPALIIFVLSYFVLIWQWVKNIIHRRRNDAVHRSYNVLIITITLWLLWFLVIGSTQRFSTYVIPFFCLATGFFIFSVWQKIKSYRPVLSILSVLSVLFVLLEIAFTANTFFTFRPKGKEGVLWAKTHYELRDWGFNDLDKYLDNLLKNKMPAHTMPVRYNFLDKIQKQTLEKMRTQKKQPLPVLIIYDSNMDGLAALWLFHRRSIYSAWPIIDAKLFFEVLESQGNDFYHNSGIQNFYFISPTEYTLLETSLPLTNWGEDLEKQLIDNGTVPDEIKNKIGEVVFRIYKF